MLPILLLPLLISFPPCFSGSIRPTSRSPIANMNQFIINVKSIEASVKGCKENCSSIHITEPKCRCFNFTVSHENCTSPRSFISGLETLRERIDQNGLETPQERIDQNGVINKLNKALRWMSDAGQNMTNICPLPVPILPKVFLDKLKIMAEKMNSMTK